jgi:hypothetical protein
MLTLAMATPVITTHHPSRGLGAAAAVRSAIFDSVPADRTIGTARARDRAIADALMDGPVMHASAAPAHAHAGRTPTVCLAGAAGE